MLLFVTIPMMFSLVRFLVSVQGIQFQHANPFNLQTIHMRKVHRTTTKELEKKESMVECSFSSEEDLHDADSCHFGEITRIVNNHCKIH